MSIYKRGDTWWLDFWFCGQRIKESTKIKAGKRGTGRQKALEAQRIRRNQLADALNGIKANRKPILFSVAAKAYLEENAAHWSDSNRRIEKYNVDHLSEHFGRMLLPDIAPGDIAKYQAQRTDAGASPRTCNLEVGTLRAILKKARLWANLQPDVTMLPVSDDVGRAISGEEERALLEACARSRSRSLLPFVTLAIETGARYNVIRTLQWGNIDLLTRCLKFGKDKTTAGTGRVVPLSSRAATVLEFWAAQFPNRQPEHYVFPSEHYGAAGDKFEPHAYALNPTVPIHDIKEAWEKAKLRAAKILKGTPEGKEEGTEEKEEIAPLRCRFHDLRHSAVSRMLSAGVPIAKVAKIVGWKPSTMVRMAARYGHFTLEELRPAVEKINAGKSELPTGVPPEVPPAQEKVEGEGLQDVEGVGSSARTRTWNPSVNSAFLAATHTYQNTQVPERFHRLTTASWHGLGCFGRSFRTEFGQRAKPSQEGFIGQSRNLLCAHLTIGVMPSGTHTDCPITGVCEVSGSASRLSRRIR